MLTGIRDYLPRQLALNDVTKTEEFVFKEIEVPSGESEYKEEYTLSKAPIKRIVKVVAVVNGGQTELTQGEDFVLDDDSTVIFDDGDNRPDLGTKFEITYTAESILSRYIDSIEEQTEYESEKIGIDPEEGTINGVTASKYISTAESDSLDEIGKLFGDLGRRAGRSTERYREYLQSIARVYTGSGRKENVAKAAATVVSDEDNTVDPESITFREWFEDEDPLASEIPFDENEYDIRFNEFENHRISLIDDVVDIADPSGVRLRTLIYAIEDEDGDYIEGPKPDLSKWDGIDSYDAFDDDFISPFNHESPTRGSYPSNVRVQDGKDVLDVDIETEIIKPIAFDWAQRVEGEYAYETNGKWQEFQWGEDSWSGNVQQEAYYTGVDWEAADWNKFPYTEMLVGEDTVGFVDVPDTTIADRTAESPAVTDEQVIPKVLENIVTDNIVLDEGQVIPDINVPKTETTSTVDATAAEIISKILDSSGINDINTLDIEDAIDDDITLDEGPVLSDIENSNVDSTITTELNPETDIQDDSTNEEVVSIDAEDSSTQQSGIIWNHDDWGATNWDADYIELTTINGSTFLEIENDPLTEDVTLNKSSLLSEVQNTSADSSFANDGVNEFNVQYEPSEITASIDTEQESVQQTGVIWSNSSWNETNWDADKIDGTTIEGSTFLEIENDPLTEDVTLNKTSILSQVEEGFAESTGSDDVLSRYEIQYEKPETITTDDTEQKSVQQTDLVWGSSNWSQTNWDSGAIDITTIDGSTTLEIDSTGVEDISTSDTNTVELSRLAWNYESWDTMQWSQA